MPGRAAPRGGGGGAVGAAADADVATSQGPAAATWSSHPDVGRNSAHLLAISGKGAYELLPFPFLSLPRPPVCFSHFSSFFFLHLFCSGEGAPRRAHTGWRPRHAHSCIIYFLMLMLFLGWSSLSPISPSDDLCFPFLLQMLLRFNFICCIVLEFDSVT